MKQLNEYKPYLCDEHENLYPTSVSCTPALKGTKTLQNT